MLRHSTAHVMAQAVTQLFPGRQVLDRPGHRERLLLRLRAARRAHVPRRRPRGDRGPDARDRRRRPAVRALRGVRRRGPRGVRRPALQASRSSSACRRPATAHADALDAGEVAAGDTISVYRNTPEFVDLCKGPHVPVDGPPRSLQAAEGRRRLLAGQREGPDAAAHLRHGVGVRRRAAGPPRAARRGREARPSPAGHRARPAQLPERARRRARRVASEGRHRPQADGGLQPPAPRVGRLRVRLHAAPLQGRAVRDQRPPRPGTPTACTRRWRWTTARTT